MYNKSIIKAKILLSDFMTKKQEELLEILKGVGLDEKQAMVYLAMLSLGPATVVKIAAQSEVKRTTVYVILGSLIKMGLANIEMRGWKQLYAATSPERLAELIDERRTKYRSFLPEFMSLRAFQESSSLIKYYEGLPAIKSAYENLLEQIHSGDEYLVVSNTEKWLALDPFFERFAEKRAKFPVKVRLLLQDTPKARHYKKFEKNFNFKIKLLAVGTDLTTNLNVVGDTVLIHQITPPTIALIINNRSIAKMHKEMFEAIWKALPKE